LVIRFATHHQAEQCQRLDVDGTHHLLLISTDSLHIAIGFFLGSTGVNCTRFTSAGAKYSHWPVSSPAAQTVNQLRLTS
jgi:multisubunit Na+/H+ antiporter MnhC subunit